MHGPDFQSLSLFIRKMSWWPNRYPAGGKWITGIVAAMFWRSIWGDSFCTNVGQTGTAQTLRDVGVLPSEYGGWLQAETTASSVLLRTEALPGSYFVQTTKKKCKGSTSALASLLQEEVANLRLGTPIRNWRRSHSHVNEKGGTERNRKGNVGCQELQVWE